MYNRFERSIELRLNTDRWQQTDLLPLLLGLLTLLLPVAHSVPAAILVLLVGWAISALDQRRCARWNHLIWSDQHGLRVRGTCGEYPARLAAIRYRSASRLLLKVDCLARTHQLHVCRRGQTHAYRRLLQCLPDRADREAEHA